VTSSVTGVSNAIAVNPVLVGAPTNFAATQGLAFNGQVATFTSANAGNTPVDFTATINWGDGTTTAGTVVTGGGGNFAVSGSHTYATSGPFAVTVTVNDSNPVATVTIVATAFVSTAFPAQGIPTTNGWVLGLLAALLGVSALWYSRRRKGSERAA
jgi:hypothetical protein